MLGIEDLIILTNTILCIAAECMGNTAQLYDLNIGWRYLYRFRNVFTCMGFAVHVVTIILLLPFYCFIIIIIT